VAAAAAAATRPSSGLPSRGGLPLIAPTKVLVIALDAADPDLLLEWIGTGDLPVLASLRSRAAWSRTENPPGLYSGAVWPSFYTGFSPADHGRYFHIQIRTGSYKVAPFRATAVKRPPFWEAVSDAGRRVAIIDVPKAPIADRLNGIQVVDWGTHDEEYPEVATYPASLAAEVVKRFGRDLVGQCDRVGPNVADYRGLRDRLLARVERKAEMAGHFLAQGGWDLFCVVFSDSHCAGHQFWHYHDPAHPRHDPAAAGALGDPLKEVYRALDAAIGRLIDQAGPEAAVVVYGSHGMGPHYDATAMLDEILRRLEAAPVSSSRAAAKGLKRYWRLLPTGLRKRARKLTRRIDEATLEPERSRRKCFWVPTNDNCGGIRVNLVGREPNGRVERGEDYERFCRALTADLMELVNAETGRPLVREVLRVADLHQGPHLDALPDLLARWNREAPIAAVSSPKIGRIERPYLGTRTGDHRPQGLVLACGPGIEPGEIAAPVSVTDLAPTLAALLGVELPGTDGRPIRAMTSAVRRPAPEAVPEPAE